MRHRSIFGWRHVLRAAVVVAITMVAIPAAALAAPSKHPNAFASLPGPGQARPPTFVGTDGSGTSIAVVVTGSNKAVAYACDGTGKVGVWFSGSIDAATGTASLRSSNGASTLTYNLRNGSGTLSLKGTTSSFSLAKATGTAGLYRQSTTKRHAANVTGWIVGNDGLLVGTATVDGRTVLAVSTSLAAPVDASTVTPTPVTVAPTAQKFLTGVRCGILSFRIGFNNQQGLTAANSGDAAGLADAQSDGAAITAAQQRLGCNAATV